VRPACWGAVGGIGVGALASDIEGHEGADLAGARDRLDIAEHEASAIRLAFDALSVIGVDSLKVETDKRRRRQFLGQDGAMDVGDRRLLEMKRARGNRP
jgi:hypothetical protein